MAHPYLESPEALNQTPNQPTLLPLSRSHRPQAPSPTRKRPFRGRPVRYTESGNFFPGFSGGPHPTNCSSGRFSFQSKGFKNSVNIPPPLFNLGELAPGKPPDFPRGFSKTTEIRFETPPTTAPTMTPDGYQAKNQTSWGEPHGWLTNQSTTHRTTHL